MGEIIRTWLRNRLGVIIDLSPDIFGNYARDGTLLAKILHSYDIINESQLKTLNRTQDPALSRVNLKNLRIWLRFIGVDCDNDCTEDISNGKGTSALRLFYKVFLALENKDSLHFITLQKEREKFIPNSSKFEVTTVSEELETKEDADDPLAAPLKESASLIDWHRKKYDNIIEQCKRDRKKCEKPQERHKFLIPQSPAAKKTPRRRQKSLQEEEERVELDEFARKHKVGEELLEPCEEIPKFRNQKLTTVKADRDAAKAYTKTLKQKYRQEAMTKNFKTRMQKALLCEVWDKVVSDQEMELDEIIARKVLDQSQWEKKMMRKLYDIRNEKVRMASNRQIVEELSQKTKEQEARLEHERTREIIVRENEEVEAERIRMKELERRINEDIAKRKRKKLQKIGVEVVNDLIDISVKVAEYEIASNGKKVPKSLWNEWKALFVKSQPIFHPADDKIQIYDEDEEGEINEEIDDVDFERVDILNEDDFQSYHHLRSPWNDFVSNLEMENREYLNLGLIVLGHNVHKVLESLYPHPEEAVKSSLPKMKIRATVLGLPDSLLYEPIQELLKHKKIHLVCLEDAINYCLEQYKLEMKDHEFIDLNIAAATKQALIRKSSGSVDKKIKKKEKKSASSGVKSAASSTKRSEQVRSGIDKVTQTPRVIPHEDLDPILSDAAYIGKWTHEFLSLGQPISDDLNARILLEYLKSLEDVQGFVLVNYPITWKQMTSLEFALSGRKLPDKRHQSLNAEEETNIEEIIDIPSRITFEGEAHDSSNTLKRSKLVPNPLQRLEASNGNSYFTSFVRIKPKELYKNENVEYEILTDKKTSLEDFYVDQEIGCSFYYTVFDLTTLKRLARVLITGEASVDEISSGELFGDAVSFFEDRNDDNYSIEKAPIVKKLMSRASSFEESGESEWTEISNELDNQSLVSKKSSEGPSRPGHPEWPWADFSQSFQLVQNLATLWQSLEKSYIANLKDMFQLKRRHVEAIIPYTNFVKHHMKDFVERPDKRQDLLHEFHRAFNNIDEDIRDDMETKHELHCRVADFEASLWDICNERRKEAEEERIRIIFDHWTSQEAIILVNVYLGILQAEIDRYTDSLQFIQEYYLSMLQRPLQEVRQGRVLLHRISLETEDSVSKEDMKKSSLKSLKEKESKGSGVKTSSAKISTPPTCADENSLKDEIGKLLMNVQEENFDATLLICYKNVEANIKYVGNIVESMASIVFEVLKKEEISAAKSSSEAKEKKGSSRKTSRSKADEEGAKKRAQDFVLEWRYAIMYEINRIRMRLKILEAAVISDINFLVDSMRDLFIDTHKLLVERYKSEVQSVNLMASTFRFAIEEATPIQKEMLLDGDRFLVRSNVLMYPDKPEPDAPPIREEISSSNFQMAQLGRLLDIFRRVAPSGTLAERSFVYILQDLIACGNEEGGTSSLPSSWLQFRACDVTKLVSVIFGDVQFIDWREFIVYAMDIEMPSVDQLLDALDAFKKVDKNSTETLNLKEFHSVGLWFFDWNDTDFLHSNSLLHEDFEKGTENIEEKEGTHRGLSYRDNQSLKLLCNENDIKPEIIMRLTLAKDLLFEMFSTESRRINYVAFLLAFCKDEESKKGLGKALSLATRSKICVDWIEGEKYVEDFIEKKRCDAVEEENQKHLDKEAKVICKTIMDNILNRVLLSSKANANDSIEDSSMTNFDKSKVEKVRIRIEKLDEPGESFDASALLPPEDEDEGEEAEAHKEVQAKVSAAVNQMKNYEERNVNNADKRELVYWLNLEACQAVLAATLPRLATEPDLFDSNKSLRKNVQSIYLELRNEDINDETEQILAHRFLDHAFIKKMLLHTSKFTTKHLENAVNKILKENK